MIKIIPYSNTHLDLINLRSFFKEDDQIITRTRLKYGDYKYAHTIFYNDICLGVIAMDFLWQGVGWVWSILGEEVTRFAIPFSRAVKRVLDLYVNMFKLWRVQVSIRADVPMLQRWVRFLGFEVEGLMRKFGPEGKDYYMCARYC